MVYLRAKHDDAPICLYILVDSIYDSSVDTGEYCVISIDSRHNGFTAPQTDDFYVYLQWDTPTTYTTAILWGNGSAWGPVGPLPTGFQAAASTDAVNDPYTTNRHMIYEFKIPKKYSDYSHGYSLLTKIGLFVHARDTGAEDAWPNFIVGVTAVNPSTWGDLVLLNQVIPEFPFAPAVLFIALIVTTVLLRKPTKINRHLQ